MPFTMTKLNINKAFFTTLIKGQGGDKLPVIQKPFFVAIAPHSSRIFLFRLTVHKIRTSKLLELFDSPDFW